MRSLVPLFLLGLMISSQAGAVGIKLSGNQDPSCQAQFICITDSSFPITTNTAGGGFFDALNQQGVPITSLDFDLTYLDPGCASGGPDPVQLAFDSSFLPYASQNLQVTSSSKCNGNAASAPGAVPTAEYMLALDFGPGVPNNFLFQIDLSDAGTGDPNAPGGWLPGTTFSVSTGTPEPVSLSLAALGFGLLMVFQARRRSAARR